MKVLYGIQGTGNGHVARAMEVIPVLKNMADVDILISGTQSDIQLPFDVKYNCKGLSFVFGKKGGIDIGASVRLVRPRRLKREIELLPVEHYDLIISDFEPITAWAARRSYVPAIGLSHQAAVINPESPKPFKKDLLGEAILRYYAPTDVAFGFHFRSYAKDIFTPVIRRQVRQAEVCDLGHYLVYLPAFSDKKIIKHLSKYKEVRWEVFSNSTVAKYTVDNITVHPINNDLFVEKMASSTGVLCGAGFETPSEALFLQKKLMVIPMKAQYEQQCNGAALEKMGVPVIYSLHDQIDIEEWINSTKVVKVQYDDHTEALLERILHFEEAGSFFLTGS